MPKRNSDGGWVEEVEDDYPADLSFLPEQYRLRIADIYDSYFGLGARRSNTVMADRYAPTFPRNVASLSSPELGNRLGEYTAWFSFLSDKRKYVAVALAHMESELSTAKDRKLSEMLSDKGNVDIKTASAKTAPEYLLLLSYVQKLRGIKTLLDADIDNYDQCIATLSRDISRREHNAGY